MLPAFFVVIYIITDFISDKEKNKDKYMCL